MSDGTEPVRAINSKIKALCGAASTDETRYALNGVHFRTDGVAEATNGRIILQTRCDTIPALELPGCLKGEPLAGDVIIPTKVLLDSLKTVPRNATLPVLRAAYLLDGTIQSTDLDTTRRTEYTRIDATYPNTAGALCQPQPTDYEVVLGVENLTILLHAAKAVKAEAIKFRVDFHTEGQPNPLSVTITGEDGAEVTGTVMPMRAE